MYEIGNGVALTHEAKFSIDNKVMLLYNPEELYYDDQIITLPKGKVFKEIGRYQYETQNEFIKTVPIIHMFDK